MNSMIEYFLNNRFEFDSFRKDENGEYSIRILLPGFDKDEVKATIEKKENLSLLKIAAKRKNMNDTRNICYSIPKKFDENTLSLELKNGILTCKLQEKKQLEESWIREIEIL
jgi:HSP20 family molecular chaperone IbpA